MSNTDFVKIAEMGDIRPTNMKAVEVAGEKICVANVKGIYYAVDNICTHEGGPFTLLKKAGVADISINWQNSGHELISEEIRNAKDWLLHAISPNKKN
jgi:nitrite reductase/ring-hydroxylating ferredoxin subunit